MNETKRETRLLNPSDVFIKDYIIQNFNMRSSTEEDVKILHFCPIP
jgi:hypothetical protein